MTRAELIERVIEMAEDDMTNLGISREEIAREANKLSNDELKAYIEGM